MRTPFFLPVSCQVFVNVSVLTDLFHDVVTQILTRLGFLNVPEWFEAGRVSEANTFIPFSEFL